MAKGIDKRGVTNWVITSSREKGYTQAFVASSTGISKHTVGAIFNNSAAPRTDQLEKLCGLFGADPEETAKKFGYCPKPRPAGKRIHVKALPADLSSGDREMAITVTVPATENAPAPAKEEKEKTPAALPKETVPEEMAAETTEPEDKIPRKKKGSSSDTFGISPLKKETFRKWYTSLLENSNLLSVEYGELIEVTPVMVNRYKAGTAMPSLATLQNICKLHDFSWKVAACFFGYSEYKVPEYWLGPRYRENTDWITLTNIERSAKAAPPPVCARVLDSEKLNKENEELKKALEELRKREEDLLRKSESDRTSLEKRVENERMKAEEEKTKLRKEADARAMEAAHLRAENAALFEKMEKLVKKPVPDTDREDAFVSGIASCLRDLLPGAEAIEITCSDGRTLTWSVKLPGMKDAITGHLLDTEKIAASLHASIREEAMSRLGF